MLNKIILISIMMVFLFCHPASAVNLIQNGDFETGDNTGWDGSSHNAPIYSRIANVCIPYPHCYSGYDSTYGLGYSAQNYQLAYINQSIDLTNVDNLTFYYELSKRGSGYLAVGFGDTSSVIWQTSSVTSWIPVNIDVSGYSGITNIFFYAKCTASLGLAGTLDDIVADSITPPPANYITWETFPPDSWKVGNYSTLMVGVPASLKNFTFFYKTPSTDYIEMPIQKHFIHKTFNVEEGEFYYYYAKFPYHATYGNYSAKIELNEAVLDSKSVIVPYFDPDITLPDTVIIPVPEVFVDPPQWNVTVPEEYGNVTWLTDYTAFCDGIGNSLNYTTYATVGLLLIPLEMLNGSVTTVNEYATDAAGMVQGFEHCSIIIKVAWDIIPSEIQTLFIGAAALGLVVFLYHRRA